ncbi:TATA-binding protein-associated factor 2N-like isoform X1 [Canna indica]|uniref:TATA-binding protein-associated factor 2N-like isoform X1 n=1 Tax=Canna indica TaxID=4628 RepID=A0AAQ3QIL5_9LILI|nr:TATA-binding protein-associated factor 2N-like isoform X1 [Canna indica]
MSSRRPGDWDCSLCLHHNFSYRDSCQKCGGGRSTTIANVLPGDWYCSCGAHNFANRSSCLSCNAASNAAAVAVVVSGGFDDSGELQGSSGVEYGGGGWKYGDWLCTRCMAAISTILLAGRNAFDAKRQKELRRLQEMSK